MTEVVVITGADVSVGRATALAYARRHARVALLARDAERLLAAARDVEAAGGRALPMPTDVADPVQVESAADTAELEFGPIDIWINIAAATVVAPFVDTAPEEFRRATEVTYLGTVNGTLAALQRMRARNRGTIVQVGSAISYRAVPLQAAYSGARFAIRGFTDSLRAELRHDRCAVHMMTIELPSRRESFNADRAAQAILHAVASRKSDVCIGVSTWLAAWSARWLPGWLDRWLACAAYRGEISDSAAENIRRDSLFTLAPSRRSRTKPRPLGGRRLTRRRIARIG